MTLRRAVKSGAEGTETTGLTYSDDRSKLLDCSDGRARGVYDVPLDNVLPDPRRPVAADVPEAGKYLLEARALVRER